MKEIFLLEDDRSMREVLSRYLRRQGFEVKSFCSPKEVIPVLERKSPSIVLSDVNMPGMNGLELASMMKDVYPSVPVFLMSANVTAELEERARSIGVTRVFRKPLKDLTLLTEAIELKLGEGGNETAGGMDYLEQLSHDIRTPLTSLKLALDGLCAEMNKLPEMEARLLTISRRNVDRLIALVDDKLEAIKTKSGV
jgi:CheY-like chemotaxis protein